MGGALVMMDGVGRGCGRDGEGLWGGGWGCGRGCDVMRVVRSCGRDSGDDGWGGGVGVLWAGL